MERNCEVSGAPTVRGNGGNSRGEMEMENVSVTVHRWHRFPRTVGVIHPLRGGPW